jgi:hypothetical protein
MPPDPLALGAQALYQELTLQKHAASMDKLCPSLLFSNPRQMTTTTTSMAIIAIVAALALLVVVVFIRILILLLLVPV